MTRRPRIVLVWMWAAALALAGCRGTTYEAEGDLVAVDAEGATIAHDQIPGLMDAMTMRFPARPASILADARPGTRVRFELVREGDALVLTALSPIGMARGTTPGTHDHRPRFGGVVSMIGMLHVEVAAAPDGRIRAWVSDLWRKPLPAAGTTGSVRLHLPDGVRTLAFTSVGDALEARTAPFTTESALANVALVRQGQPLDMNVLLDLTGNRAGVPIVPQTGCVSPSHGGDGDHVPRCVVTYARTFTALGTTPDGTRAVIAIEHGATSVWALPEATLVMGVDPPPPLPLAPGMHEPDPHVIAVRPDGAELVITLSQRLAFFDASTGRFLRELESPGGMVQSLVWTPDGTRLLVASAADGKARVLDAADAHVVRTIEPGSNAIVVAIDATGRWAAVGTDTGTIAVIDLTADAAPRVLEPSLQPVAALAFAGDRLVSAGSDKTLRVFDPASGQETARVAIGTPLVALAVALDGRRAATADVEHRLRVHRLPDGAVVEQIGWHRATVSVLAWGAGGTLVSGDNDGELAVWDVPVQ